MPRSLRIFSVMSILATNNLPVIEKNRQISHESSANRILRRKK